MYILKLILDGMWAEYGWMTTPILIVQHYVYLIFCVKFRSFQIKRYDFIQVH